MTNFPKADSYWISPTGKVLPVSTLHITEVLANHESYSFRREQLEAIYEKHGERLGGEGKAREEIMTDLLKRGWFRIRYVAKQDAYTIQCFNFDKRQRDYLSHWAKDVIANDFHQYADVRLDTGDEIKQTNIEGLISANAKSREKITYITDSYEFLEIPAPQD
ncbi:MAG: hypothetical protein FWF94_08715 [Oscillospiraceae bacterium]|nr:hypothetical protein [Oscillospiraceae bacterium]